MGDGITLLVEVEVTEVYEPLATSCYILWPFHYRILLI